MSRTHSMVICGSSGLVLLLLVVSILVQVRQPRKKVLVRRYSRAELQEALEMEPPHYELFSLQVDTHTVTHTHSYTHTHTHTLTHTHKHTLVHSRVLVLFGRETETHTHTLLHTHTHTLTQSSSRLVWERNRHTHTHTTLHTHTIINKTHHD